MKIVVGICGIGNGHSLRQFEIISKLYSGNHKLVIYAFGQSYTFFCSNTFNIPVFEVFVPWIESAVDGINFKETSAKEYNKNNFALSKNFEVMHNTKLYFNGFPDLIISDYEPVSAQFAYATNTKLVTIDQQSKFLGYCFPNINSFTREEEKSRLSLFFPKAIKRFSVSFYRFLYDKDADYDVKIVSPIIRQDIVNLKITHIKPNTIVVYFSPYGSTKQSFNEFIELFKKFDDKQFFVFNSNNFEYKESNVTFLPFNRNRFTDALKTASGIITTAGHTLLSELLYLKIPVISIPLNTYDQNFCAYFIEKNNLGIGANEITESVLSDFFKNLELYKFEISQSENIFKSHNGADIIYNELLTDNLLW